MTETPHTGTVEALRECPFCGDPLFVRSGANPYGRCETDGCWMAERAIMVPFDDRRQVESWNTRAALASTPTPQAPVWPRYGVDPRNGGVTGPHDGSAAQQAPVATLSEVEPCFLAQLRRINSARLAEWEGDEKASPLFHATELGGEVGEVLNVAKKLHREAMGWRGSRSSLDDLADELGDVMICLDKLAHVHGIDLAEATARKFNATSEKQGFAHRLAALSPKAQDRGAIPTLSISETVASPSNEERLRAAVEPVAKAIRHADYEAFETDNFYGDAIDWPLARHIAQIAVREVGAILKREPQA